MKLSSNKNLKIISFHFIRSSVNEIKPTLSLFKQASKALFKCPFYKVYNILNELIENFSYLLNPQPLFNF